MNLARTFATCIGTASATLALTGGVALACTQPLCWPAQFAVPAGAQVPANVPALLYDAAHPSDPEGAAPDPAAFSLLDDQGNAVQVELTPLQAGSHQFRVRPIANLIPGKTYQTKYPINCGSTSATQVSFIAGPQSNLPTNIGVATASGHRIGTAAVPDLTPGVCPGFKVPVTAALAKVTMSLSPEMRAYWPLATLSAKVGQSPVHVATQKVLPNGDVDVEVHSLCGTPIRGADLGLAPGKHLLELRVALPGITVDLPPLTAAIELSCAAPGGDGGTVDGGMDAGVDPGIDSGTIMLDANGPDGPLAPKASAGGGCSAASGSTAPQGLWLALTAFAALLWRRKTPARS